MIETITINEYEKYRKTLDGPHGLFIRAKSNHLIVYFGSYAGEFRGHQSIIKTNSNGLLIRSNHATWYLDEEYSLGSTPIHVAHTIVEFIKKQNHIQTITLAGFSMGGFGALLYGTWIPCNKIIANVPQTRAPTWKQQDGYTPVYTNSMKKYMNIKDVWTEHSPPKCNVFIRCCEQADPNEKFNDIKDAQELRNFPHVNIIAYPCKGHMQVSNYLLNDRYDEMFLPEEG